MKTQVQTSTIGAGNILIRDHKVLLVKPNYGRAKGSWIFPGGFLEANENPEEAAKRELFEETGLRATEVKPFCVRHRRNPSDAYWVFRVFAHTDSEIKVQTSELLDAQFIPLNSAIESEEVRPMTRYFLQCSLNEKPYSIELPEAFKTDTVFFFTGE